MLEAQPQRVISIDFGWWPTPEGRRALLTWWADTGALVLGDDHTIAVIGDELDVRRRLNGWAEHAGTREGLGWLAQRLEDCR